MKMLVFGAVVGALAAALSAGWGFAQLSARARGVPSRRTIGTLFPYVTLGIAAYQWMGVWALTSSSPLVTAKADQLARGSLLIGRTGIIRLLITASCAITSLRLWGLIGGGLRPGFNGIGVSLFAQGCDAVVTILLWMHLRSIAIEHSLRGLGWRSIIVMVGRGSTLIFLFVVPLIFAADGHPLRLTWDFLNIRYCVAVLWDVIALLVLVQFAIAFLRIVVHRV